MTAVLRATAPRTKTTETCSRLVSRGRALVACKTYASWLVGLRTRAHRDGSPVDYYFQTLKICNQCRLGLTLSDVQTDRTLAHVSRQLLRLGHEPPKRRLSTLVFRHLRLGFESEGRSSADHRTVGT